MMRAGRVLCAMPVAVVLASMLCVSPAAHAAPESPLNEAATEVTATTATLRGQLNPGASSEALKFEFRYNVAGGGSGCFAGFAAPEPAGEASGNHAKVATPVAELTGNTEYLFCLLAINASEELAAAFPPGAFKTLPASPVAETASASAVTPFDARLRGTLKSENQETTYRFEYATNEAFEAATTVGEGTVPPSIEGQEVGPADIGGGLTPATTYYFRLAAKNATGESKGPIGQFTTLSAEAPAVESESTSAATDTSATLEASVNPFFQATTCSFSYVDDASFIASGYNNSTQVACEPEALGSGGSPVAASAAIAGLTTGTTYHYRVSATNATGTTQGPDQTFTTLSKPFVVTGAPQFVGRRTATLAGTLKPDGAATTYRFLYIDQAGYEAAAAESAANPYAKGGTTPEAPAGSGFAEQSTGPVFLSELRPGVTYHYALFASNALGTSMGADRTFTTSAARPPIPVTGEAVNVTQVSATLTGAVDTRGLPTNIQVEIGAVPYAGMLETATVVPGSESGTSVAIATSLAYLQPATTYYYRMVASSQDGTGYGAERSFVTPSFSQLIAPAPVLAIAFPAYAFPAEPAAAKKPVIHRATSGCTKTKRGKNGHRRATKCPVRRTHAKHRPVNAGKRTAAKKN
jgi:hypothetical protein